MTSPTSLRLSHALAQLNSFETSSQDYTLAKKKETSSSDAVPTTSTTYASNTLAQLNSFEASSQDNTMEKKSEASSLDAVPTTSTTYAQGESDFLETPFAASNIASKSSADDLILTNDMIVINSQRSYLIDEPNKFYDSNKKLSAVTATVPFTEVPKGISNAPTTLQSFDPEIKPVKTKHWCDCFKCCC